jgi:hypothetical protein
MLNAFGTSNGPPHWSHFSRLVFRRTVDTRVFHGILTSLPLRFPHAGVGSKQNGTAGITPFRNGFQSDVREHGPPIIAKSRGSESSRLGLVSGITEIHFLQDGRLVNRMRVEPLRRYVQEPDTDLTLRFDFTQDGAAVQGTLYEMSMMFMCPSGMPLRDTRIYIRCPDVSTQVYHALLPAVSFHRCIFPFADPLPSYAASFLTPYIICILPFCFRPGTL